MPFPVSPRLKQPEVIHAVLMVPRGTAVNTSRTSVRDQNGPLPQQLPTPNRTRELEPDTKVPRPRASSSGARRALSDAAAKRRVHVHVRRHDPTRCALDECGYLPRRKHQKSCADTRNGARPRHGAVLDFPYPRWACSCTGALRLCCALEPFARMQYDLDGGSSSRASLFVHGNRARRNFM